MRTLLLLRHATTEDSRPGAMDHQRRLTAEGEQQAADLGAHLRDRRVELDLVLCSPAARARQTAEGLGVTAPVVIVDRLYNAGGDEILDVVRELPDDAEHVLVVGHAPGLPAVVHELADPDRSDPESLAAIARRFPAGTLAVLDVDDPWSVLNHATLVAVHLP